MGVNLEKSRIKVENHNFPGSGVVLWSELSLLSGQRNILFFVETARQLGYSPIARKHLMLNLIGKLRGVVHGVVLNLGVDRK